ncbi:MAG TPA: L-glutamate gamma-semialdehyde dehydrogenase [Phycisphaerales bacterium]|nr:L-glutamate gamma-semialdehyde dehydrogenase [Phycisphaerales bacterium]
MYNTVSNIPKPVNEPIFSYAPNTTPRRLLQEALQQLEGETLDIPLIIGGREIRTGKTGSCIQPHAHSRSLGQFHKAGPKEVHLAIEASQKAKKDWENLSFPQRASIFLKAADLLSSTYRYWVNAAAMLNLSKNVFQAEIDSACELIDFWRFNAWYMQELYKDQPLYSTGGTLNGVEYRPLEGFVFAVTPFNFVSIGGNLCTAPAMLGNTVLWKPASTAVYPAYWVMKILQEAGLPDGVINFVPGAGADVGDPALASPLFAGLHFTGSTEVFQSMWKTIGGRIADYKSYPRVVGETGGKDFMVAHASADPEATIAAIIRGAYEYQGQKCSALSRMYIAKSLWKTIKEPLIEQIQSIRIGPPQEFGHFMNAVIDKASFTNTQGYIDRAAASPSARILVGGGCDDRTGYFIEPTLIETDDPHYETMEQELFAPVLTAYIYDDADYDAALRLCDQTSPYGLTGCVFARDRYAIAQALEALRHSAGNFYINDKPTGAVVGQQPFGGGRGSGTNDKAGSMLNLLRWVSVRTIKETFTPPSDYRYPFMD